MQKYKTLVIMGTIYIHLFHLRTYFLFDDDIHENSALVSVMKNRKSTTYLNKSIYGIMVR